MPHHRIILTWFKALVSVVSHLMTVPTLNFGLVIRWGITETSSLNHFNMGMEVDSTDSSSEDLEVWTNIIPNGKVVLPEFSGENISRKTLGFFCTH